MPEHDAAPLGERHPLPNWEYANAAARTAATGFIPSDVTKWAKQLDNGTYWELTDDSPVTWVQVAGPGLTPGSHAASHQNGGSDEISVSGLSGVLADPQVADKIIETDGPTTLDVGAVLDGQFLRRDGTDLIGTNVFEGVIATAPTTLADGATIATDASLNNNFRVTLGGNRTLGNPTNALDGQILTWEIIQDGTGSRTLALDTKFALGTDITSITLTTTASKRDFLTAIYNSVTDKFYVRAFVKGY